MKLENCSAKNVIEVPSALLCAVPVGGDLSPLISHKSIRAEGCKMFSLLHPEIKCSSEKQGHQNTPGITVASIALDAEPDSLACPHIHKLYSCNNCGKHV